jgi:hypothetical protein
VPSRVHDGVVVHEGEYVSVVVGPRERAVAGAGQARPGLGQDAPAGRGGPVGVDRGGVQAARDERPWRVRRIGGDGRQGLRDRFWRAIGAHRYANPGTHAERG